MPPGLEAAIRALEKLEIINAKRDTVPIANDVGTVTHLRHTITIEAVVPVDFPEPDLPEPDHVIDNQP